MIWDFLHILSRRLQLWAGISIVGGLILVISGGDFWRGFGLQAMLWGIIDAGIASFGLRRSVKHLFATYDLKEAEQETVKVRKILWINTGLDILYIVGGLLLWVIPGRTNVFLAGTGAGIVLQGGFLLIFDFFHALWVPKEYILPDFNLFTEPEHNAITLRSGGGAILIVHGFPGSPAEMCTLGEALHRQGWTVRMMRLPGHGPEYQEMFLKRAPDWLKAVEKELEDLKKANARVLLAGFSIGGACSLITAHKNLPDGLILMAPFYLNEPWWLRLGIFLVRPWMPLAINPFLANRWLLPLIQKASKELLPGFDFDREEVRTEMRRFRIPLIFIEQFRWLSRQVEENLEPLAIPVLIVQGTKDLIIRTSASRKLARSLGAQVEYFEIPGDHNINQASNPAYPLLEKNVLKFTERFIHRDSG